MFIGIGLGIFDAGGKLQAETMPVNTVAPVVTGVGYVGQVLSTTNGSWSGGGLSYTYQWQRSAVNIGGATSSTYTMLLADEGLPVRCVVTATNTVGAVAANSNANEQWVPTDMPAVKLWFDAWDTSTMAFATGVSSWTDRVTGLAVTQATGAAQPIHSTTSFNGLPSVTGSGSQSLIVTSGALLADILKSKSGSSAVSLHMPTITSASVMQIGKVCTNSSANARLEARITGATRNGVSLRVVDADVTQNITDNTTVASANVALIETYNLDYAVADQVRLSSNGIRGGVTAITSAATATSATDCGGVSLFSSATSSQFFTGRIACFIITEQSQTAATEEKAEGYLAHRWALTSLLPGGHPFKTVAPTP